MTESTYSEARFGILDEFTILEVSLIHSANYHACMFPLLITPSTYIVLRSTYIWQRLACYIYVWVRGHNKRTSIHTLLDPKLFGCRIHSLGSRSLKSSP